MLFAHSTHRSYTVHFLLTLSLLVAANPGAIWAEEQQTRDNDRGAKLAQFQNAQIISRTIIKPDVRTDFMKRMGGIPESRGKVSLTINPRGGSFSGTYTSFFLQDLIGKEYPIGFGVPIVLRVRSSGSFKGTFRIDSESDDCPTQGTVQARPDLLEYWIYSERQERFINADANTKKLCLKYLKSWNNLKWSSQNGVSVSIDNTKGELSVSGGVNRFSRFSIAVPTTPSDEDIPKDVPQDEPPVDIPEMPPTLFIQLKTDKDVYPIGKRVVVKLRAEIRSTGKNKEGAYVSSVRELTDAEFTLKFHLPGYDEALPVKLKPGDYTLGDDGTFEFTPLAPISIGQYKISAMLKFPQNYGLKLDPRKKDDRRKLMAATTFRCRLPTQTEMADVPYNIEELTRLFQLHVPANRNFIQRHYAKKHPGEAVDIADMSYGSYNNWHFGINGYQCAGYQRKTVDFLSWARFDHLDANLMVGIQYGPVIRGFPKVPGALFSGEHHAVAVYRFGKDFDDDSNVVYDPWPRQEPAVFKMKDFRWCYGVWFVIGANIPNAVAPDPEWGGLGPKSGFPTHHGAVYWNTQWPCAPMGEPLPKRPKKAAPPYPAPSPKQTPLLFLLNCPAAIHIENDRGEQIGFVDGKLTGRLPGSEIFAAEKSKGDYSWYIALPDGKYRACVQGLGNGSFELQMRRGGGATYTYRGETKTGEKATMKVDSQRLGTPLTLADGTKIDPKIEHPPARPERVPTTDEAIAKLKQLGGISFHYNYRAPGRPVILVDCTNHPRFDDSWMIYLRAFPQLENLSLVNTLVTDKGLMELRELRNLQLVDVTNSLVTDQGIRRLKLLLPHTKIVYGDEGEY